MTTRAPCTFSTSTIAPTSTTTRKLELTARARHPSWPVSGRHWSYPLKDGDVGLAAALAHGDHAVPAAGPHQGVQQRGEQPRAGGAERMAQCDRTAADVDPGQVRPGLPLPGQHDRRERLVDLDEVDLVQAQAGPVQRVRGR